jgi:hypothetical protein
MYTPLLVTAGGLEFIAHDNDYCLSREQLIYLPDLSEIITGTGIQN